MTNKPHLNKATPVRGRVVAASLLIGGAVGFLNLPAHAEQAASAPAATPQLAMTKTAPAAEPADYLQTPKVQAFETAPSMRSATLDTTPASAVAVPGQGSPAALRAVQGEDVPWALATESRPWPLAYAELNPLNTLVLVLPSEREARIMLPGYVADAAERARFTVTRYITDNIGSGAQVRGRQLETFNVWAENTTKKKQGLPQDPWAAYQFNKEALATLKTFKDKVQAQTAPDVQRMSQDIKAAVEKISPVMEVMSTYEQKMQWYNVLVQLKEGIGLYQARVAEADRQILDAIAAFERDNPPVARPVGNPPRNEGEGFKAPAPTPAATSNVSMTPDAPREAAEPPARKAEQGNSTVGFLVLLAMGAAVVGLFMRLRKRLSKKGVKAENTAS